MAFERAGEDVELWMLMLLSYLSLNDVVRSELFLRLTARAGFSLGEVV